MGPVRPAPTLVKPEYSSVVTVWISVQQITSDTITCRGPRAGLRETAAAWMAPGRGLVRRGGGVWRGGGAAGGGDHTGESNSRRPTARRTGSGVACAIWTAAPHHGRTKYCQLD